MRRNEQELSPSKDLGIKNSSLHHVAPATRNCRNLLVLRDRISAVEVYGFRKSSRAFDLKANRAGHLGDKFVDAYETYLKFVDDEENGKYGQISLDLSSTRGN